MTVCYEVMYTAHLATSRLLPCVEAGCRKPKDTRRDRPIGCLVDGRAARTCVVLLEYIIWTDAKSKPQITAKSNVTLTFFFAQQASS